MIYRFAFLIIIVSSLCSCASSKRVIPAQGEFDGIKTALQRQDCVNIVMIHGMAGYSPGDPDTLKNAIVKHLKLCKTEKDCKREIIGEIQNKPYYYGDLKREEFKDICNSKVVRFYVINWHPTVDVQKRRLVKMDEHLKECREKSIAELKSMLINNTTADTLLYISSFRPEIEHPVIQSIRWIMEDSPPEKSCENLVVGYSMGGSLFINSLISMQNDPSSEDNKEISKEFIDHTSAVFFLSNSYPLNELLEDHPKRDYLYDDQQGCELTADSLNPQDDAWNWKTSPVGLFVHEKRQTIPDFQIVSFCDPNDLFGYYATGYLVPTPNGEDLNAFFNKVVINVKSTPFGFLDPRDAHTGYGKNPKVIRLIIDGLCRY